MRKTILFLAFLITTTFSINAQLLWKISGNNSKRDSYLFGTHHVAPTWLIDSVPSMRSAIELADVVIGEMDMMQAQEDIALKLAPMMMAPSDSTLNKVMTAQQLDSLDNVLRKYTGGQFSVDMVIPLKPAAVTLQIAAMQNMVAFPEFDGTDQLDTKIQQVAVEMGKPIRGFETAEQQISMLMSEPISIQAEALIKAVREDSDAIEKAKLLAQAYLNQDIDTIAKFISEEMDSEGTEKLLTDRNKDWLKQLSEILPKEKAFVAVGVGHLVGKEGLIQQLKKLGYTVQPVY